MQRLPTEQNRVPRLHAADQRTHVSHGKTTMSEREQKRDNVSPIRQSGRHVA